MFRKLSSAGEIIVGGRRKAIRKVGEKALGKERKRNGCGSWCQTKARNSAAKRKRRRQQHWKSSINFIYIFST